MSVPAVQLTYTHIAPTSGLNNNVSLKVYFNIFGAEIMRAYGEKINKCTESA